MKPKYPIRKRAEFTVEERKLVLELIAEAERNCDPRYASNAARFWMQQLTPRGKRRARRRQNSYSMTSSSASSSVASSNVSLST